MKLRDLKPKENESPLEYVTALTILMIVGAGLYMTAFVTEALIRWDRVKAGLRS